jgi:PIN domain nuclease of toxin-antitoxin system
VLDLPGVRLAHLSPEIHIESSFLAGSPPGDIADRLFVALACANSLKLLTPERGALLNYAAEGYVRALAC